MTDPTDAAVRAAIRVAVALRTAHVPTPKLETEAALDKRRGRARVCVTAGRACSVQAGSIRNAPSFSVFGARSALIGAGVSVLTRIRDDDAPTCTDGRIELACHRFAVARDVVTVANGCAWPDARRHGSELRCRTERVKARLLLAFRADNARIVIGTWKATCEIPKSTDPAVAARPNPAGVAVVVFRTIRERLARRAVCPWASRTDPVRADVIEGATAAVITGSAVRFIDSATPSGSGIA